MGEEADADWNAGLIEYGREETDRAMFEPRLINFLKVVRTARWRQVPKAWHGQLRVALSENLVRVGWGGVIELTDAGEIAARF